MLPDSWPKTVSTKNPVEPGTKGILTQMRAEAAAAAAKAEAEAAAEAQANSSGQDDDSGQDR